MRSFEIYWQGKTIGLFRVTIDCYVINLRVGHWPADPISDVRVGRAIRIGGRITTIEPGDTAYLHSERIARSELVAAIKLWHQAHLGMLLGDQEPFTLVADHQPVTEPAKLG